jgi:hypothetical protein
VAGAAGGAPGAVTAGGAGAGDAGKSGSAPALAGAKGNAGGAGGNAGAQDSGKSETLASESEYETITIIGTPGGNGGLGGNGGSAGNPGAAGSPGTAGNTTAGPPPVAGGAAGAAGPLSAANAGGAGGDGGKGGQGANSNNFNITIDGTSPSILIQKGIILAASAGGAGGKGGDSGADVAGAGVVPTVLGGSGGSAGNAGNGSSVNLKIESQEAVLNASVLLSAGNGGNGGDAGAKSGTLAGKNSGSGGNGGHGGNVAATFDGNLVLNETVKLQLISGSGGKNGTLTSYPNNTATAGAAGKGGNTSLVISGDLLALKGSVIELIKGTLNDGLNGTVSFRANQRTVVSSGQTLSLNLLGPDFAIGQDDVLFNVLVFNPGSSFSTGSQVYTSPSQISSAGKYYRVRSLDVLQKATFTTEGVYQPDTALFDFMRFDISGVKSGDVVLSMGGNSGVVSLSSFDPMAQHEKYLNNPHRPAYADDPAYRDYVGANVSDATIAPAFITTVYENKSPNLGEIILISKTSGTIPSSLVKTDADGNIHYISDNSSLGDLYDNFAFSAGLRRYYFDLYVSKDGDHPLIAKNIYTADASEIYISAISAAVLNGGLAFESVLRVIDESSDELSPGKFRVASIVSGGYLEGGDSGMTVENFSAALALTGVIEHRLGSSSVGVFAEYGEGSYDLDSAIPLYGQVRGEGTVKQMGGGFFVKTVFNSNTFLEFSARSGEIRNDFNFKKDPWMSVPLRYSARFEQDFMGFHVGLGQKFRVSEANDLTLYGKYFYTRYEGADYMVRNLDKLALSDYESSRARVGLRLDHNFRDNKAQFFVGVGAEREFAAKISAILNEKPFLDKVDYGGTSGYGEIGLIMRPLENLEVSFKGFAKMGDQKGGGGHVGLSFNF